jgi:hypothetical protein
MKAERRHELQTNALAQWLSQAPEFFRKHGSKLLTLVIVVLLVLVVLKYTRSKARERDEVAAAKLANAQDIIQALERRPASAYPGKGAKSLEAAEEAKKYIQEVLAEAGDKNLLVRAQLTLGDYYWAAANYPERDPVAAMEDLKLAEQAYRRVLAEPGDDPMSSARAHLAMAAIAENQGYALSQQTPPPKDNPHWDQAEQHYKAVMDDGRVPEVLRKQGEEARKRLPELRKPLVIAPATARHITAGPATDATMGPVRPTSRSTTATTAPSGTRPATATKPASRPGTRPIP